MGSASNRSVSRGAELARAFVFLSGGALTAMAQMTILPSMPQLAARFAGESDGPFIAQQVMTVAGPALAIARRSPAGSPEWSAIEGSFLSARFSTQSLASRALLTAFFRHSWHDFCF